MSAPSELRARVDLERRLEAHLDARLEERRAAEARVLETLRVRAERAGDAIERGRAEQAASTAELARLRAELRRLGTGLHGLRRLWVRFGEPVVASLTPTASAVLLAAAGALHLAGIPALELSGVIAGALTAVLLHRSGPR